MQFNNNQTSVNLKEKFYQNILIRITLIAHAKVCHVKSFPPFFYFLFVTL